MDRNGMFLYTALDIFASIAPHYLTLFSLHRLDQARHKFPSTETVDNG